MSDQPQRMFHYGDKIIELVESEFPDKINIDNITHIDYSNLYGEYVTVSSLLNRVGLLRSEAETRCAKLKKDFYIFENEQFSLARKKLIRDGVSRPSEKLVESEFVTTKEYRVKAFAVINAERDFKDMDSIYWGVNSKCKKLDKVMKEVTPEELSENIFQCTINTFMIRTHKNKMS